MPSNQEARALAMRLGASVVPYHQSEGMCDGLVSWWLRNQLQGKTIFRDNAFDRVHNVEAYMQEPEGRFVPSERGFAKGKALQVLFHDKKENDRLYITDGVRSDRPDKAGKNVGEFVRHEMQSISDFATTDENINNLRKCFIEGSVFRYAVKLSIKAITAHAVGLDCIKSPRLIYFDPNLGQFVFSNVEQLIKWWRNCYQNRNVGGGAFGMFKNTYHADFYQPL